MTELVYPAPSLVVGLGRFGLGLLERLGEDWQQLRLSGADRSLENLRLLWVHPDEQDEDHDDWRQQELEQLRIARHVDDGDLPSIALDFLLLRTLGLIRHQHRTYQVAVPRDHGAVRASDLRPTVEGTSTADEELMVRRRFFDWQDLDPDPLVAAEKLQRVAERQAALHLFMTPLISRVRQGHSPWVLLATILRCQSLIDRRDPSPWRWVRQQASAAGVISRDAINAARQKRQDHDKLLDHLASPPLQPGSDPADPGWEFDEDQIQVPSPFRPSDADPEAPIDPLHLLKGNWETAGWATNPEERGPAAFRTLKVSHFRLGLFDHAGEGGEGAIFGERLGHRLRCLGALVHRGLVRLWVDLKREQVEEHAPRPALHRTQSFEEALHQSLQLLRELMVQPLREELETDDARSVELPKGCVEDLPSDPTRFLRSLAFDPKQEHWKAVALERRLRALGLSDAEFEPSGPRRLMREVGLPKPSSTAPHRCSGRTGDDEGDDPHPDVQTHDAALESALSRPDEDGRSELRKVLNQEVRQLLDFSYLASYRKRPTRSPPRLTVFVVADMSEPFARLEMTSVLRDVHAELLRSFSSMFELNREGFDRALSVVPILWMPHPADPFGGEPLKNTRLEEAVIIDSVHRVRRWVESILPSARRRISQIFINGRVTDMAVLSVRDSIDQTRDFLSFQIRNDLSRDDWLRRTAVGPGGDDFFASFACSEIEFPAERAREYLGNRMARDCLHKLRTESGWRGGEPIEVPTPVGDETWLDEATSHLETMTEERAQALADTVWEALPGRRIGSCRSQAEILKCFDERLEERLWQGARHLWRDLTLPRGPMDDWVDHLRQKTSQQLRLALPEVRRQGDEDIVRTGTRGLPAVLSRIEARRREAFGILQTAEDERRKADLDCDRHRSPGRGEWTTAREAVVEAAEATPDCGPQRIGLLAWVLMTPATGLPLTMILRPVLGPLALPVAALILSVGAGGALWLHTRWRSKRLERAIEGLAASVRRLVTGRSDVDLDQQAPSLRSFLEMRLRLTAALARRGFALHVYEQSAVDERLGHRLRESVGLQEHRMIHRAEALGVRPAPPGAEERDDLRGLFARRSGGKLSKLINPDHLIQYYRSRVRPDEIPVGSFLSAVGGLRGWRKAACVADTEAVLTFGRGMFGSVANEPITELDYFSDAVGGHLRDFVARNYSNLGFGAKFIGYEGLDPDGVRLVADAALVADQPMVQAYLRAEEQVEEQARADQEESSRPRTLECVAHGIRPNAAYMLSLVQGVRAHSVRNLRRFESFHDRPESQDPPAVHHLTDYERSARDMFRKVRRAMTGRSRTTPGEAPASKSVPEEHGGSS